MKRYSEKGSHHLVLVVVAVVVLIGILGFVGYNSWQKKQANAGGTSTLGSSRSIVYTLSGSSHLKQGGAHVITPGGKDTFLSGLSYIHFYDVSSDGQWLLAQNGADGSIGAVSVKTKQYTQYVPDGRNCYSGSIQDEFDGKFAPSKSSTTPPTLYYSVNSAPCKTIIYQSGTIYRVGPKGKGRKVILRENTKGVGLYIMDISNNETLAVSKWNSSTLKGNTIVVTKAGTKKTFKNAINAALSGNGKKLVYSSGSSHYEVNMNATGKVKLALPKYANDVALNYDGSKLGYYVNTASNAQKLYAYTVKNKAKVFIDTSKTPGSKVYPNYDLSPDGSKLVFTHIDRVNKKYQLVTASISGHNKKVIKNLDYMDTSEALLHWR